MRNTVIIGTNYNSWERGQTAPCRLRVSHPARELVVAEERVTEAACNGARLPYLPRVQSLSPRLPVQQL